MILQSREGAVKVINLTFIAWSQRACLGEVPFVGRARSLSRFDRL